MILSSICIILTKQCTLSVTRPFDSSLALYYKRSIVTMHLSCTVMEIWHLKDNGVMSLTFWGHVTSSVTWPFYSQVSSFYGWSIVTMCLSDLYRFLCRFLSKSAKLEAENFHYGEFYGRNRNSEHLWSRLSEIFNCLSEFRWKFAVSVSKKIAAFCPAYFTERRTLLIVFAMWWHYSQHMLLLVCSCCLRFVHNSDIFVSLSCIWLVFRSRPVVLRQEHLWELEIAFLLSVYLLFFYFASSCLIIDLWMNNTLQRSFLVVLPIKNMLVD